MCIYNWHMQFTWDESKCALNLKSHGLDFVDASIVFEGLILTFVDDRFHYSETAFCYPWFSCRFSRINRPHGE